MDMAEEVNYGCEGLELGKERFDKSKFVDRQKAAENGLSFPILSICPSF